MTAETHNSDPRHLRRLLEIAGISQRQAAKLVGITDRMMRYYLDPKSRWRAPEKVVKKLEELAMSKAEVVGFVVGRKYRTTVNNFHVSCGLVSDGQEFTCHYVDDDGDCWSCDVAYKGRQAKRGWCAAAVSDLKIGRVVEVTESEEQARG